MKNIMLLFITAFLGFAATAQDATTEKIYRTPEVDSKPNLKDGMYKLTEFVGAHFKFPEIKNKKIRIFTSFIIEPDGTMREEKAFFISVKDYLPTTVVAIRTAEEKLAETRLYDAMKTEAARVLALFSETWIPATVKGKPVKCLYNYPISFNIE